MAEGEDQENKTEEPTHKRLEEARKKGQIANSREVSSFFLLGVLALTISWFAPSIVHNTKLLLIPFFTDAHLLPTDGKELNVLLRHTAFATLAIIAAPLLASMVSAIAASFIQNGFMLSAESIMPKLNKISPLAGLKRMFSMKSVIEFVKSLIKITIIGVVAFLSIYPELSHIRQLPNSSVEALLLYLGKLASRLTMGVVIAMFFIAIFDVLIQRFQHIKSLRMSKQEVKDEHKQSEGDPMVKMKLRQLRQERARKRMMAAVPEADVVITNPTHFAVALKYDTKAMKAPTVVAKGQDLIALKMREVAEENDVPVVENPPLARALFASAKLDEEIPFEHYEAVAKVISYVYKLKGKKA